ncbi:MAG: 50S ribosomal protein L24 [Pontiellaceae bacterium]|jgi:large subunit ribosomal protein L24|nr:50S ribosomal protein L24 [Pontiellaceae bacterium]
MAARIKKGDVVVALCGDDKGKTGRVLQVLSGRRRAVVEGLNMVKKHMRKTQDKPQGGVVSKEASIHLSNLKKSE